MMPSRRIRDAAVVLPIAGLLLFMPPYVQIFDQDVFVFGIPLLHVYLFTVWLAGIVITGVLARRLVRQMDADAAPDAPPRPTSTRAGPGAGAASPPPATPAEGGEPPARRGAAPGDEG